MIEYGNDGCGGSGRHNIAFWYDGHGAGKIMVGENTTVGRDIMESNIIICTKCSGEGYIEDRVSMHSSERAQCNMCNGKGRLRRIVIQELKILEDK